MTRTTDQPATLRIFALLPSLLVAALGATVLAGWALDVEVLKSVLPGLVSMKPNTAVGLLLTGSALALLSRESVGKWSRLLATAAACAGITLGLLSLGEDIFGWDAGIDQWLFRDVPGAVESSSPGRMSPSTAFCLVLMGIALVLASRTQAVKIRLPVISALSATMVLVAGLALAGHLSLALFNIRVGNYAGLAMHTAAGFFLLGIALLAWVRSEGGLAWSLDVMTTAGFAVGVASIFAVAGISYIFTGQLREDAKWVSHTEEVLKEIEQLTASQRDLTLSLGRYLITRDESSVNERARIEAAIQEDIDHIRRLTADNPRQQSPLDQIERLTGQRVAMSNEIIAKFRQQASSAGAPPAANRGESPLGREYPLIGQHIDQVLKGMEAEEQSLLQQRQALSDSSSTKTFLLMPVGVYLSLTVLLLGLFFLNSGTAERKRAEDMGRESETYFHTIFEATPDGMIIVDRGRKIVIANPAAEKMFGYAVGLLRGVALEELVPEANREALLRDWSGLTRNSATGASAGTREIEAARKDGSIFPVELTRNMFGAPGGSYVLGVVRDISERKQIEVTRARLVAIVEASDDAIIGKMLDGTITSWNPGAERLFGYTAAEAVGRSITLVIPQDRLREENLIVRQIAQGDTVRHYETVRQRKDGTPVDISVTVSPIRDADGTIIGASKIARDIGERKRAEEKLRESEHNNRMLMESLADGVFVAQDYRFVFANPALLAILGYSQAEFVGLPFANVVAPEFLDAWTERFTQRVGTGPEPPRNYEVRFLRNGGGDLILELRASRVPFKGRLAALGVIRDTTERKRADDKIRRLNRVYAVLSGINNLIVRTRDREELFRGACRIAVEQGAFKMAWIGEIDPETLDGKVVAWCGGEESYVEKIPITARDGTPASDRPACRALRLTQPVISNDIATDPSVAPIRKDLLARGHKSIGCFPLTLNARAEAVLSLCSGEVNTFDEGEMRLLRELAGDISFALDHIQKAEHLDYLAYYDEVTGLANRTLFRERVGQFVSAAGREGKMLAIAKIDIERFKTINDTFGRQAGDALLRQIAKRARLAVTDPNWLACTGGDRFAAVFPDMARVDDAARRIALRYREIFEAPFDIGGTELRVADRLGIAMFPEDGADADTLMRNAESALKKAKASGERYLFYAQQMTERVAERLNLENKLRRAVEKEEFVLHYQPKVDLASGAITGVEALIRWNDPATGLVPPGHFIPLLEETGLILEVGSWALTQAVRDHSHWLGLGVPAPRIAVNVSPIQLRQRDFVETVKRAIASGASPTGIDLEITESLIMEDMAGNIAKLNAIRELGLTLFIDDFGTGYSSLGYLARLPVQSLKIDRSFVVTMLEDPNIMTLVSTIISLAHSLKLKVVAEGVDKDEQAKILRLLRCEEMQGYLFSKPVPRDEIAVMLARATH
jgi:PAS domain S-box-containing protein/diguanylate cyclase (GGDEF)-like protein